MRKFINHHGKRIEVEEIPNPATPRARRATKRGKKEETFAMIPHQRAIEAYKIIGGASWIVLIEIDRLILEAWGRNPIRLPNKNLEANGLSRNAKWEALVQLENAGIIKVVRRGKETPLVALLWRPLKS
jgi:hypothetical protein